MSNELTKDEKQLLVDVLQTAQATGLDTMRTMISIVDKLQSQLKEGDK